MAAVVADLANVDKIAVNYDTAAKLTSVSVGVIRAAIDHGDLIRRYPTSNPIIDLDDLRDWVKNLPTVAPPKKQNRK
jgi:hypothetical protein